MRLKELKGDCSLELSFALVLGFFVCFLDFFFLILDSLLVESCRLVDIFRYAEMKTID